MKIDLTKAFEEAADRLTGWVESFISHLPDVVAAIVVLVLFILVAKGVKRLMERVMSRFSSYADINRVVAGAVYIAVIGAGVMIALGILGWDKTVTSLLAGAGIIGLALGFAFQDTAENFIAGVLLNVRREFTYGDIIKTNDFEGIVERVEMRATMLRTFDGLLVVIPNAEVFKHPLINYSGRGLRRVDLAVGVSYGDDLENAAVIAARAVEDIDGREAARPVEVFYESFGDSSINFQIRFWIDFARQTDYLKARSEAIIRIKRAFDEAGVTIPFPIRTLDFSPVGGVVLGEAVPPTGT